jgi:hypothetical protein
MRAGVGGDGPGRNPHNFAGKSAAGKQHLFSRVDGQRPTNLEDPCWKRGQPVSGVDFTAMPEISLSEAFPEMVTSLPMLTPVLQV